MKEDFRHFFSGIISGCIHTIIGFPFDTLKSFKQSLINTNNIKEVLYFKGVLYPVLQSSLMSSITFGSKKYFEKNNDKNTSNFYTGLISSVICTPLDKFKIARQFNINYSLNIKNIFYSFNNFYIVALRELPAQYLYFSTYDYLRKNNLSIFLSGSISGVISWVVTYPIDTIKTRIQSNKSKNIIHAYKKGNLFAGIQLCVLRAFIVNGVNFSVYEYIITIL